MADSSDEDLRGDIVAVATAMVRGGFQPRNEIWLAVDDICEEGADPDALRAFAAAELERLWSEQRAAEAAWVGRTDCERLDQAFAELEGTGIVCRQDFSCCGTCGAAEIGGECAAVEEGGVRVRGYAFYHQQDTEHAIDGHGVYLSYGADEPGRQPALAIAREIIAVLESHGLKPTWSGSWSDRIHVPLEWRRRFVSAG
jgi:hypothetical protein